MLDVGADMINRNTYLSGGSLLINYLSSKS